MTYLFVIGVWALVVLQFIYFWMTYRAIDKFFLALDVIWLQQKKTHTETQQLRDMVQDSIMDTLTEGSK